MELKNADISVCRTCLSQERLKSIFDKIRINNNESPLFEMLMECAAVKIMKEDNFPHTICTDCEHHLKRCYIFKKQCEKVDTILHLHANRQDFKADWYASVSFSVRSQFDLFTNDLQVSDKATIDETDSSDDFFRINGFDTVILPDDGSVDNSRHGEEHFKESERKKIKKERLIKNAFSNNKKTLKRDSPRVKSKQKIDLSEKRRARYTIRCAKCNETFVVKSEFIKHKRLRHGDIKNQCDKCGKCFKANEKLLRHSRIHTGEKPHECKTCGRAFSNPANLQRHNKIHSGEKSYVCHVCSKAFIQGQTLANHLRVHAKEKPFKCKHCDKSYSATCSLYVHVQNKHSPSKRFEGTDCAAKTKKKKENSRREYLCCECGKKYVTKTGLDLHMNFHKGVKPHRCLTCGKSFSQIHNLKSHAHSHTGESKRKSYDCRNRQTGNTNDPN